MVNPTPSIAVTSTLAMVRTAEARGAPAADLLERAGLARATLEDPDARIPAPIVLGLWNALRQRTGDPALQLAAPATLPFGAYRVIDYVVAASGTVGEGIERFARFFELIAEAITLRISKEEDGSVLSLMMGDGGAVAPIYVDYVFAALVTRIRMRIRPALKVGRVEFCQPEPQDTAPYREVFRAPLSFSTAADRLYFSAEEWSAPTQSPDAALALLLEEHARVLARRLPGSVSGFRADVEKAIASAPDEGGSAADVARALHMSVRTLQRRLDASGSTFRDVSNTVRCQLAQGYLTDRKVSIAEVAFLLGFSDQSSFHRAFRRWTGESPGRWRKRTGGTSSSRGSP
jgi:AraC-like DNA-binding protein